MEEVSSITEFGKVLIFLITGLLAVGGAFAVNKLIAPHHPNPEKNSSYECGEEPTGSSWIQFNSRFYVIALIFLLFHEELPLRRQLSQCLSPKFGPRTGK